MVRMNSPESARPDFLLIQEITHCTQVEGVWSVVEGHPCRKVVNTQVADPKSFQVPEP